MAANNIIKVTDIDFDTIKENLKSFLSHQSEFRDYDFESSTIQILLNLLSYNTYYNAFYMNMIANEMFLDTAVLRSSVVSQAKALGYTSRSATAATATGAAAETPNFSSSSLTSSASSIVFYCKLESVNAENNW